MTKEGFCDKIVSMAKSTSVSDKIKRLDEIFNLSARSLIWSIDSSPEIYKIG